MDTFEPVGGTNTIEIDKQQLLGDGYFSKVFIGRYDKCLVAVKRIQKDDMKFEKEANELRQMDHQNIVRYRFFDSDDDFEYVVMEKCECSLEEHLNNQQIIDELSIMGDICYGVHYLHMLCMPNESVIHRNIHTSNVLMSRHGDKMRAKISDFGIAKHTPAGTSISLSRHTRSLRYNNPEELRGQKVSEESDIYALGLCFYTILSKKKSPFGDDDTAIAIAIKNGDMPDLSEISQKYAACSQPLVWKMLSSNKEDRPKILGVLNHCLFWDAKKIVDFLNRASDFMKGAKGSEISKHVGRRSSEVTPDDWWTVLYCNRDKWEVDLFDCHFQLDPPDSGILGLLRRVRNFAHHIDKLRPVKLGQVFDYSNNRMIVDITSRFPNLLPVVYDELQGMKSHEDFAQFYLSPPKY